MCAFLKIFNVSEPPGYNLNGRKLNSEQRLEFPKSAAYMLGNLVKLNITCAENSFYLLDGYLQSWKYFKQIYDNGSLKQILQFREDIRNAAEQRIHEALGIFRKRKVGRQCGSVVLIGVHARRGDLVG